MLRPSHTHKATRGAKKLTQRRAERWRRIAFLPGGAANIYIHYMSVVLWLRRLPTTTFRSLTSGWPSGSGCFVAAPWVQCSGGAVSSSHWGGGLSLPLAGGAWVGALCVWLSFWKGGTTRGLTHPIEGGFGQTNVAQLIKALHTVPIKASAGWAY